MQCLPGKDRQLSVGRAPTLTLNSNPLLRYRLAVFRTVISALAKGTLDLKVAHDHGHIGNNSVTRDTFDHHQAEQESNFSIAIGSFAQAKLHRAANPDREIGSRSRSSKVHRVTEV